MKRLKALFLFAAAAIVLPGCSNFTFFGLLGDKSPEYKGAQARSTKPLEVPPELTSPTVDDRYAIPDPRAQTTYSAYSQRNPGTSPVASGPTVLPKFDNVRLERAGDQRWLVVQGEPDKVWPAVREFWLSAGYALAREMPEAGIMETEWHEDRSKIPDDIVRRTVGRVLDRLWSTARRDKFRTRLEKGAQRGTTEIFVSNRAVEEQFTNQAQDTTKWVPIPADPELEAEMLARIQVRLGTGAGDVRMASAAAPGKAAATPAAASASTTPESRNAVLQNSGAGPLVVNDSFDRAWRRVGLALDRVGFTVEDRDRSKGLFFVRYIDPEADNANVKKEGILDKLAFWRPTPKTAQPQYRIHVAEAGAGMSQVQVQNSQGTPEASSTGKKILTLLFDQLK
ncbi:MAG TPA: outer membrane protein assembly factor BamC [Usitatibacter sp.]|nr:outer membrane protein assembly factor BamC [Usitatibacter sp.]